MDYGYVGLWVAFVLYYMWLADGFWGVLGCLLVIVL